jgi:hypothetical protein
MNRNRITDIIVVVGFIIMFALLLSLLWKPA